MGTRPKVVWRVLQNNYTDFLTKFPRIFTKRYKGTLTLFMKTYIFCDRSNVKIHKANQDACQIGEIIEEIKERNLFGQEVSGKV